MPSLQNLVSSFLGISLLSAAPVTSAFAKGELPSQSFRQEHVGIKKHLQEVGVWVGDLEAKKSEKERSEVKAKVVGFFKNHIKPHAEWEEKVLYPAVDSRAAKGSNPFTATMRYEHTIVGRWTDQLESQEVATSAGARKFMRSTDRLIGLIDAHFEEEEEVLLPILDKSMSKEQFEKEISAKAESHSQH